MPIKVSLRVVRKDITSILGALDPVHTDFE